jgi:hypothetical protein
MLRAAQLKRRSVQVLSATPSLPPPSSSVPVPSPSHLPAQLVHSTTISELQVDHSTRNRSRRREASSSQESTRSPDNRSSRKGSPVNRSSDSDGLDHKHSLGSVFQDGVRKSLRSQARNRIRSSSIHTKHRAAWLRPPEPS